MQGATIAMPAVAVAMVGALVGASLPWLTPAADEAPVTIQVGVPRIGDAGAFRWIHDDRPTTTATFAWQGFDTRLDRWGVPVETAVAAMVRTGPEGDEPTPIHESRYGFVGTHLAWIVTTNAQAESEVRPFLGPLRQQQDTDFALDSVAYPPHGHHGCELHHAIGDLVLLQGEQPPLAAVCPGLDPAGIAEVLGTEATQWQDRAALRLSYQLAQEEGVQLVALTFADRVPVPVEAHTVRASQQGPVATTRILTAFSAGDGPEVVGSPPDAGTREGLTTGAWSRHGPGAGDLQLRYPLIEAVSDVRNDATLREFQAWYEDHPDSVLVWGDHEDDGWMSASNNGPEVDTASWSLVFAEPGGDEGYWVQAMRYLGVAAAGQVVGLPDGGGRHAPVRTSEHGPLEWPTLVPAADALPAHAADLGTVVAAWALHAPAPYQGVAPNRVAFQVAQGIDGASTYILHAGHGDQGSEAPYLYPVSYTQQYRAGGVALDALSGGLLSSYELRWDRAGELDL